MPLLTPRPSTAAVAPDLARRRQQALDQVRQALRLVHADPEGARLRDRTSTTADPDGPLGAWLYPRWWCGPGARTLAPPAAAEAQAGSSRLEAARRTVAPVSDHWLVLAAVADVLLAARLGGPAGTDGRRQARTDAVVHSSRPGLPPRPGDLVSLVDGSSALDEAATWWWAHTQPTAPAETDLERWYVHVPDLSSALHVLPVLLEVAAEVGCPLSVKCPPWAGGYGRRDAMVAYLPAAAAGPAGAAVRRRAPLLAAWLDPDSPPLTTPLLPGLARAEDPGTSVSGAQVSYGQLRCGQVAAVAARLGTAEVSDGDLADVLQAVGIDAARPDRVRP